MRARLVAALAAVAAMLATAPPASAGCGLLNASPCPRPPVADPAARTPGSPVPPARQVNRATFGFSKNAIHGTVRPTARFGIPDAGTVPIVGAVGAKADDGSYVMYESRVDDRTIDLMVWSAGLLGPAPVRIQLPPSWGSDPGRRYPALFLLHGGSDPADYQCWSVYSQFSQRVGDLDALIVMPSAGVGGHTTNYWNFGFRAGKQYQTFVSTELVQILQRGYAMGDTAAVAGASAGARSAFEVAYKRPDLFRAAAAYSGLLDTQYPGVDQTFVLIPLLAGQTPYELWGDPGINARLWNDRNPAKNTPTLSNTALYVSTGDGRQASGAPIIDPLEPIVNLSTRSFLRAAKLHGVAVTTSLGHGLHTWPYFDAAFGDSLPMLAHALGLEPQPQPPHLPY